MNHMKKLWTLPLALAALAIGGCGGGGGSGDSGVSSGGLPIASIPGNTPSVVPDGASVSSTDLVTYLRFLANSKSENADPLSLGAFAPPQPDNTEPESIT